MKRTITLLTGLMVLASLLCLPGCSGGGAATDEKSYGGEVKQAPGATAPQGTRQTNAPSVDN